MAPEDSQRFTEILTMMSTVYSSAISTEQIKLWFRLLEHADIEVFESVALEYMKSDAAFMPKPGQILARILCQDGRPGPEEAWNMVKFDERDTNVWTVEMASAFWPALRSVESGDRIGARMAFLETYKREVEKSRSDGKPVSWSISLGHDPARRLEAISAAVGAGHLEHDQACAALPHLEPKEVVTGRIQPLSISVFKQLTAGTENA